MGIRLGNQPLCGGALPPGSRPLIWKNIPGMVPAGDGGFHKAGKIWRFFHIIIGHELLLDTHSCARLHDASHQPGLGAFAKLKPG